MRKFRAWDKHNNCMILSSNLYVFHFSNRFQGIADYAHRPARFLQPGWLILMQYTGLKDKNDVEICEGDIVTNNEDRRDLCDVFGVVKYGGMAFGYYGKKANGEEWFDTITSPLYKQDCCIKVIGNIYENPEGGE